jgi:hypothetical protein
LRDRLLSIRDTKNTKNKAEIEYAEKHGKLQVYGLPLNTSEEYKRELREHFSKMGKLIYYYATRVDLSRISNSDIAEFYNQEENPDMRINVLNICFRDSKITQKFLRKQFSYLKGSKIYVSKFAKNKPLNSKTRAKNKKYTSYMAHPSQRKSFNRNRVFEQNSKLSRGTKKGDQSANSAENRHLVKKTPYQLIKKSKTSETLNQLLMDKKFNLNAKNLDHSASNIKFNVVKRDPKCSPSTFYSSTPNPYPCPQPYPLRQQVNIQPYWF